MTTPGLLADRITALDAAHPWMDATTKAVLANQPVSTDTMLATADQIRQQAANTYTGSTPYFYDPALHQPSPTRAFAQQYVNTVAGGNPFDSGSLATMQRNLQAQGFGQGLSADGFWTGDWQQALVQHARSVFDAQQAGNRPGQLSTTSHGLLHSVLHAISPSGIASAVVGTIKSLPEDFRRVVGDAISGNLDPTASWYASHSQRSQVGAGVEQLLGGKETAQQVASRSQGWNALASAVNDAGTLAILAGGAGDVGAGVKGLRALGSSTDLATAQSGQGVILSSLGRTEGHEAALRSPFRIVNGDVTNQVKPTVAAVTSRLGKRVIPGTVLGGTAGAIQAKARGTDVLTGAAQGAVLGGTAGLLARVGERTNLLPSDALDNLPVLKQTGPLIDKLASSDGLYYKLRNTLAKPYEYGAVRIAGSALAKGQATSLKLNGLSWLENTVGDDPNSQPIARYIAGSHPLDPIDQALAAASQSLHLPFTPKVDWLMYVLHGDLNAGLGRENAESPNLTGNLSRQVQAVHDAYDAALGQTGYAERIVRGTGASYDTLLQHAGGDELLLKRWMLDKVNHAAASLYAEKSLNDAPAQIKQAVASDHQAWLDWHRNARDAAFSDNSTLRSAHEMLAQAENTNYLETYLRRELAASTGDPRATLAHDIGTYTKAAAHVTDHILPLIETDFLTPQTFQPGVPPALREAVTAGKVKKSAVDALFPSFKRGATGPVDRGSIGVLAKGRLTSQAADADLKTFAKAVTTQQARISDADKRLRSAEIDMTERNRIAADASANIAELNAKMKDYAFNQLALDRNRFGLWGNADRGTSAKMLSLLTEASKNLASEVFLAPGASDAAKAAKARLDDLGYTLVHGKDIGHSFRADIPRVADLGRLATRERQVANTLGLGAERFSHTDLAATMRLAIVRRLQSAVENGDLNVGQHATVRTLLNDLGNEDLVGSQQLPWAQNLAFALGRRFHQRTLTALAEHYDTDLNQAEARLKGQLALAGGVRNLPRKTVVKVLTRLDGDGVPIMSEKDANRAYDIIMAAQGDTKTYQVGLTHLEDLARFAPYRLAGTKAWDIDGVRHLLVFPNALARARDNWRFALNPMFSVRRIVKTSMKMWADGVKASPNPVRALQDRGAWDDAHQLLDTILGAQRGRYDYLDEAERYLDQNDLYGIYNPRQHEAYYAWQKKQQGFSDEDIRKGLIRVFGYGGRGQEGRTALERSTNLLFFPFSFEKTVIRNIGGYLADHQAQALVLSQALDAYRQVSADHPNAPLTKDWLDRHAPILNEALRLNAFAHGISPGEMGGINAPLFNAFMPQSWATSGDTLKTLGRFVPMITDLHRIVQEANQQQAVVRQSVLNGMSRIEGHGGNDLFRLPSNEAPKAQIGDALIFRQELLDAFRSVIDFNDGQSDANSKYRFGYGDNIPAAVRGQVIDRTTLGLVVQHAYPAWNPNKASEIAKEHTLAAQSFINAQHGRPDFTALQDYFTKAETAIGHLNRDEYPAAQGTQIQALFREQAATLAKRNPGFRSVYDKTFARYFGPLGI